MKTFRKNNRLINAINIEPMGHDFTDLYLNYCGLEIKIVYYKKQSKFYLERFFKDKYSGGKKYRGIQYLYQIIEYFCELKNIDIKTTNIELTSDYLRKATKEEWLKLYNENETFHTYKQYNHWDFEQNEYGIITYYKRLGFEIRLDFGGINGRLNILMPSGLITQKHHLKAKLEVVMNNIRKVHKLEPIIYI